MKLGVVILIFIAVGLLLFGAYYQLSGFAINDGTGLSVSREITKDDGGLTKVKISISSDKNMLAIKENLPSGSFVSSNNLEGYEVSEFKESDNTWLIADSEKKINGEFSYLVDVSAGEVSGKVVYLEGEDLVENDIAGDSSFCVEGDCSDGEQKILLPDFSKLPIKIIVRKNVNCKVYSKKDLENTNSIVSKANRAVNKDKALLRYRNNAEKEFCSAGKLEGSYDYDLELVNVNKRCNVVAIVKQSEFVCITENINN